MKSKTRVMMLVVLLILAAILVLSSCGGVEDTGESDWGEPMTVIVITRTAVSANPCSD